MKQRDRNQTAFMFPRWEPKNRRAGVRAFVAALKRGNSRGAKGRLQKFKDAIRLKTSRTSGQSLTSIVASVNQTLRGWFTYFQHSHPTTFVGLDCWIRMRLRSILRKRHGRRGCGRGRDHQRWPNAHFAAHGLFSLVAARKAVVQSSRR